MPELKPDSPILEGLMSGQCYADHDGVRCYPAIHLETGDKYIIKVISIPASSVQAEALYLTGAVTDAEDAKRYFRTLADGVVDEARILNELSLLEGFVGCERVELEEDPESGGYLVYLLTPYREAIEAALCQGTMTQLQALNMGLDLCAALAACRRSGYMYVDLKPANIYLNENGSYCIGDLGFISLKGLKYASLPGKYHSSYTAPEMADCFTELNETLDIFALGMVLYHAYNGGELPFEGTAPAELIAPPMYADYELAEIILKACHPDPSQRWQDPAQIAQALTGYMQRNSIEDAPIVPPPPVEEPEEEMEVPTEDTEEFLPEMSEEELATALAEEEPPQSTEQEELEMIAALAAEDSSPEVNVLTGSEEDGQLDEASDEETAQMLAQAEELMYLVPPEPVVAPEAVHVPDPASPAPEADAAEEAASDGAENQEAPENTEPAPAHTPHTRKKKKFPWTKLCVALIVLLILASIGFGGYYYYSTVYLQYVDAIQITGTDSSATVTVVSRIDESLLEVVCTDSYGNSHPQPLKNGTATFDNLNPQTRYTVSLRISGFHELRGEVSDHFTTATQTEILTFNASVGPVDGSVNLSFTFTGPEPESWKVIATADGQPTLTEEFTGNAVTVSGLTVGSRYTFLLEPVGELYMAGQTQVEFTAVNILFAQEPQIVECHDGMLKVVWSSPAGETVESWTLRCYNATGYDVTVTTTDLEYIFQDVDLSAATTVEITAAGMIKSVSVSICANPITIWDYTLAPDEEGNLLLSWNCTPGTPECGWVLAWTLDGAPQQAITCEDASALIPIAIPGGSYEFILTAPDGTRIYNNTYSASLPEAEPFAAYKLTVADMTIKTFRAPNKKNWTYKDVGTSCLTSEFTLDQEAYVMLSFKKAMGSSKNPVKVTYVLHSADGTFISTESAEFVWNNMWVKKHCILQLPVPATTGEFVMTVYFDGMLLCELPLAIT